MIGNETRYHSPGDTLAALDPRSLQHMGDQALAVARELSADAPADDGSVLFTDVAGRQLVMVPQAIGFALLGLLVLGFAAISIRRGGALRGLALVALALIAAAAVDWAGMFLMGLARPGSFWRAYPVWTHLAAYGCGIFAAIVALALIGRRLAVTQLRAGFWLIFLALGLAVLFIAPGGVIYFLLPPLVLLIAILVKQERTGAIVATAALWLTFGEVVALLGQLMVKGPFFVFASLAALMAMPWLIEAKTLIEKSGRSRAILASAGLLLLGWAAVAAAPAYSADRQQRFVIQHATDTVSGRAYWSIVNDSGRLPIGYGGGSPSWKRDELPYIEGKRWIAPAPSIDIRPPKLHLLGARRNGKLRTVIFRIETNGADSVTLIGSKDARIVSAGARGFVRPIASEAEGRYFIGCSGRSCDGAVMQLTTAALDPLVMTLVGSTAHLPQSANALIEERPKLARPQYSADSTLSISRLRL